ncbi:flagellar basal body rod protein FlgC [Pseudogemmobacter humi]|uniref:Flagellar basal-body rod protein FlgC n=1 Tax=Pseudogemmobacter humi TaxID=2483812 RepID=A0A3P5WLW7_9RHOB|nr:flagellar basal body rod protein FlgC [Pseudogemmobacter humi]VDC20340.1 Flagellar basal-body rod protein FlgC [Pseudogemmobacter humi]
MDGLTASLAVSAAGMEAQASRLRHVSENIANADTPGYRRKVVSFDQAMETGLVRPGPVRLDQSELPQIYDPGNPLADETGHYRGSNVDLIIEIADAREAQRSYDANLRLFDQARQMTQSLFEILRR